MPRRRKQSRPLWTPNQIVAFNVAKARLLRGWTQEQAAEALAPYLGTRLSGASFSAIERSVDVARGREFNADELLAFARGFRLPLAWFFTPPSAWEGVGVATPDAGEEGLDPLVMLHAVLGTPETLEPYKQYLFSWPDPRHRLRIYADGTTENLGPVAEDVHPLLDEVLRNRARRLLRDRFGDVDQARDVLNSLTAILDELDEGTLEEPTTEGPRKTRRHGDGSRKRETP
jgi:hypothetical protein